MNKKKLSVVAQIVLTSVVLIGISACTSTPNNAPVIDRADRGSAEANKSVANVIAAPVKAPFDGKLNYVVKKGDTLFRIALDHGQSYSDIVAWNSLKNPNDIKVDQVLRVAPPDAVSTAGVQTSSISSGSGSEIRSLTAASGAANAATNVATNKNYPRGDKKAYSEAALAELQKPDTASNLAVVAVVAAKSEVPAVKSAEKSAEKSADKVATTTPAESDAVDWMWPVEGKIIANFDDVKNKGLDIGGKLGQDVLAAAAGKVMYEGSGIRGYGNLVIIKHSSTLLSAYAHNKTNLVKEGQVISRGQKIAEMGSSDSDAVKLHFEIRQQGKPVDPAKFLPGR
ncbi:peptidoglycan DD-metalloendopeptidase family protein [Undibacterium sp.]|uniref:peptidoglycan DD-metalloendopeptidase family protein n=1 Tax=Undibacterium sp. TaxID=1914977 RepID=UPI0025CFDFD4|nr:peptidoglycan DD-metalloendopeptidase family protein [Undibacterium sp.]